MFKKSKESTGNGNGAALPTPESVADEVRALLTEHLADQRKAREAIRAKLTNLQAQAGKYREQAVALAAEIEALSARRGHFTCFCRR